MPAESSASLVTKLFHEALDLPPEQRQAFLEEAAGLDAGLRTHLLELIRADEDAGSFHRRPFLAMASEPTDGPGTPQEPLHLEPNGRDPKPPQFPSGTVLAERYRIVQQLGSGGMGEVYLAEDQRLGQRIALKVLHPALQDCGATADRFTDEVLLARQITHPNVCRVYDLVEADGHRLISMEYIEGEGLHQILRRAPLPFARAQTLALQLCRGLDAAHREGILHRDLKPANLMVDSRGVLKMTDFGLASAAERVVGFEARHGTPAYMAPEQQAGREATVQSEIYALGLVLHELFTGQRANPANWKLPDDMPPHVADLIERCLRNDPTRRPASVRDVERVLVDELDAGVATLVVRLPHPSHRISPSEDPADWTLEVSSWHGRAIVLEGPAHGALFERPAEAIGFALEAQRTGPGWRLGVHLIEISGHDAIGRPTLEPDGLNIAIQLATIAEGRQTLLTRGAFDLARSRTVEGPEHLGWQAHGNYEIHGLDNPLAICEVGEIGLAPLRRPRESSRLRAQILQPALPGWRPAPGLALPERPDWAMDRKIAEGGFGEVWLARNARNGEERIFKFCYDAASLRTLQREITLFRLLKETLGERRDISRIYGWNFDQAPYYIESELTEGGSLEQWAESQGGLAAVPLARRLEIVAQVATALSAAHSVGVLHKDVKPGNVLVRTGPDGRVEAKLSDFGLGLLTERDRLDEVGVTALGFTEMLSEPFPGSSYGGTRLYMAPELLEGRPASMQSDLYALGVLLYQVVVGDFRRALAPGWERDVDVPLLRQDIALAVDRDAERRLSSGQRLAERLRRLDERRADDEARNRQNEEAARAAGALEQARRRGRFAVAALLLLALFAGTVLFQSRQTAKEARNTQIMMELFEEALLIIDPVDGRRQRQDPSTRLEALNIRIQDQLAGQTVVQAELFQKLGKFALNNGHFGESEILLRQALALHQGASTPDHAVLAEGYYDLADILRNLGKLDEALESIGLSIDHFRQAFPDRETAPEKLSRKGLIHHHKADTDNAELYFRRALEDTVFAKTSQGAETRMRLGVLLHTIRRYDDAEAELEQALVDLERIDGQETAMVAQCKNELAQTLTQQEEYERAERLFFEGLALREKIFEPKHPDTTHSLRSIGVFYLWRTDFEKSKIFLERALADYRSGLGEGHPYVATVLHDLGILFELQGDAAKAREHFISALSIREAALGQEHPLTQHTQKAVSRL